MPATDFQYFDINKLKCVPFSRVAAAYGRVWQRQGRSRTLCPWHDDHSPSLVLYEGTGDNHCYCFACNHGGSVVDFVMQQENCDFREACRIVASIGGIVADESTPWTRPRPLNVAKPKPDPEVPPTYIPMEWVESHISLENSLCKCLLKCFDSNRIRYIAEEYMLGCLDEGERPDDVLFPSIDDAMRVHNIKVQRYTTDPSSPRFARSDKNCCYWLGKRLVAQGVLPAGARFDNDCLFGAHLLNRYPRADVMLVESPKNAIFGAAMCPQHVWVATGSKSMLKRHVLLPLRNRNVLVYPDRDAISEWTQKLDGMRDLCTFHVSDFCELQAPADDLKFDIADFILSSVMH